MTKEEIRGKIYLEGNEQTAFDLMDEYVKEQSIAFMLFMQHNFQPFLRSGKYFQQFTLEELIAGKTLDFDNLVLFTIDQLYDIFLNSQNT